MFTHIQQIDAFLVDLFFINPASPSLAKVFLFLSWGGAWGFVWIFIMIYLVWKSDELDGKVSFVRTFFGGMILILLLNTILKITVGRLRPFVGQLQIWQEGLSSVGVHTFYPPDFAFPSLHAMSSFLAYYLISSRMKSYRNWLFFLALMISYSRLYLGMHYFADVVVGGVLGVIIGRLVIWFESKNFAVHS